MKISWIKYEKDNKNFIIAEKLGMNVNKITNPEEVDSKIEELVKENYDTIVLSNEIAFFSGDILKKYKKDDDINIIITKRK